MYCISICRHRFLRCRLSRSKLVCDLALWVKISTNGFCFVPKLSDACVSACQLVPVCAYVVFVLDVTPSNGGKWSHVRNALLLKAKNRHWQICEYGCDTKLPALRV